MGDGRVVLGACGDDLDLLNKNGVVLDDVASGVCFGSRSEGGR